VIWLCNTSGCCAGGFIKQVAVNAANAEAPTLIRERVEIRLDENLYGLFAGMNLDTNRRAAKFNLVASPVLSSSDGVGHYRLALKTTGPIRWISPSLGQGPATHHREDHLLSLTPNGRSLLFSQTPH
jgi:hypothetical protein